MVNPSNVVVPKACSGAGREVGKVYVEVLGLSRVKEMFSKLEGKLDAARDLIEQMEDIELGVAARSERPCADGQDAKPHAASLDDAAAPTAGRRLQFGEFNWRRPDEGFDQKFARALREVADWFEQGVIEESLVYSEFGAPVVTVELNPNEPVPKVGVNFDAYSLSRFAR